MKLFINITLTVFILIKAGIFRSKSIIFDNTIKKKAKIQNIITINEKGDYVINGEFNNYTFSVNSNHVNLNFIDAKINNSFNPIIIIQNNLYDVTITLNNTKMYSIQTSILKIKRFDYVKFNAYSSYLKGDVIFDSDDKYKLNINGNITLNQNEKVNNIEEITLNNTENKILNKTKSESFQKTQKNNNLNKNKKEILKKKQNKGLNKTKNEVLNKIENKKQLKQEEKKRKKEKKRKNKHRNNDRKKKNQIKKLNNSKNIINKNQKEEKIEKNKPTLRKLLLQKNEIIEPIKIINKNLSINWEFSILCKDELNINNLNIKFYPIKIKSKNYFSEISKQKKKKSNNKQSTNLLETELNCKINIKERIILTMTSWKKRINHCKTTIELLLTNSLPPYKLILNLAEEEFPRKNLELPESLLSLLQYPNFEIFWVKENNKVFKKLIPTINRYKKDLIITVDDDVIYPNNLIEKVIYYFRKHGSKNPMSFGGKFSDWKFLKKKKSSFKRVRIGTHYGACSIVKYDFFKEKINELYYKTTESKIKRGVKCFDDFLYTYAALLNGYFYIRNRQYSVRKYVNKSPKGKYGFSDFRRKKDKHQKWNIYHNIIKNYIRRVYKTSVADLIMALRKRKKRKFK